LIVVTGVLVLLGIIFAEPLIRAFAAEQFTSSPEKLALTVQLARIMLPSLTLIAVAAAFMGMLNSLHHYFIPALSPAMFNVLTIVCAFALVPLMPAFGLHPIVAIAIGTLLGGVAQLALQWPTLHKEGFRYQLDLDWRDEGLRRMLTLMGPGTIGMAATQVNVFVNTVLATSTVEGAVSWLNYAFRLMYLPIGLFGVSIATAALPTVSRQTTLQDHAEHSRHGRFNRAGRAHRARGARTRPIHASRYCRNGGRVAVLCHWLGWLLGSSDSVANFLCDRPESHACCRQHGGGPGQRVTELPPRPDHP
jgi:putative peptidoglycan lipid II flippase